jgi:hypothetical protein
MGGSSSSFKTNIDGVDATEVNNIEIAANDSIYVFVQVNINPDTNNLPFIIKDSILINYNGNNKFIQLQAYGQNANFLNSRRISGNVIWSADLPYVVLGGLLVDSSATLTIQPGSKVYLHANAPILIDGTLIVNGTKQDKVIFNGDRLDPDYKTCRQAGPAFTSAEAAKIIFYSLLLLKMLTRE